MKTGVRLFVSSGVFGVVISGVYWIVAREPAGTALLGIMAMALFFIAGWAVIAERDAHLEGDQADMDPREVAGERIGTFVAASTWPACLGLCVLLMLSGAIFGRGVTILGALGALGVLWKLVLESR